MRLFLPSVNADHPGFLCVSTTESLPLTMGPCRRCVAEAQSGSPPASGICYAFQGAFEGASTCQKCGHSWHDHQ
jgi:hypothetical protein